MKDLRYFVFKKILLNEGWLTNAFVGVDSAGLIQYLSTEKPTHAIAIESVQGFAIPGFQNSHSHAFQYAMAGKAEKHPANATDDFWSWREAMYGCALTMDPAQVESIATMLYAEMLRKGYTHVAEFHYLHHDKNGKPYSNLAEMGERLVAAAATAGIKITLIPIFYQQGNFGQPHNVRQRRFISSSIDDYFHLLDDTAHMVSLHRHARLGFGVHSLRAVNEKDIIKTIEQGPAAIPFHLHAAEQLKEVDDCINHLGQRPVEWLLNNASLNERFHLVHCTHLTTDEVTRLAASKAHAVLCPGTEGNLGDGIFQLTSFAENNGSWSIGTDSHISLNPVEDLRWLDYAQRFTTHKRNTFDDGASVLINKTWTAGQQAMGLATDQYFAIGQPLDAAVFNAKSPLLAQAGEDHILQAIVYTTDSSDTLGTLVDGHWVINQHTHKHRGKITAAFNKTLDSIL